MAVAPASLDLSAEYQKYPSLEIIEGQSKFNNAPLTLEQKLKIKYFFDQLVLIDPNNLESESCLKGYFLETQTLHKTYPKEPEYLQKIEKAMVHEAKERIN